MEVSNIKIISYNVISLGDLSKRNNIFQFLDGFGADIICISRFNSDLEIQLKNNCKYICVFSSFSSQAREVTNLSSKTKI